MDNDGQLVNTVADVTLIGWFLTGRCNVNEKKNCPFKAAYKNNLKIDLALKIEQRK